MTYDNWKAQEPDDEWLYSPPPPCEQNYTGRLRHHPRYPSGYCVICGAEAHEGCKHPLAVGEWEPKEP